MIGGDILAKIAVQDILKDFSTMWKEHWSYLAGAANRRQVDCSGAFVWSYKQHGCNIYHGSNRIARTEVLELYPIKNAQIIPGMVAFKARSSIPLNLNGYSLPDSYKKGGAYYNGDLLDYYHVGLVDETGKFVYNAQSVSTGFVRSDISKGGWSHVGLLLQVDYAKKKEEVSTKPPETPKETVVETKTNPIGKAVVSAPTGNYVKMRRSPSKSESLYWDIPVNSLVEVLSESENSWTKIRYNGRDGYMMSMYLDDANG